MKQHYDNITFDFRELKQKLQNLQQASTESDIKKDEIINSRDSIIILLTTENERLQDEINLLKNNIESLHGKDIEYTLLQNEMQRVKTQLEQTTY